MGGGWMVAGGGGGVCTVILMSNQTKVLSSVVVRVVTIFILYCIVKFLWSKIDSSLVVRRGLFLLF